MKTLDRIPVTEIDIFDDEALLDPYPVYRTIRDLGSVVRLSSLDMYAVGRHAEVRRVLADWETFSSARGVFMNDLLNTGSREGNTLCSDRPLHDHLRRVVRRPLTPAALATIEKEIYHEADRVVRGLVSGGTFDAVTNLAQHLPMTIIANQVGLPGHGREKMLEWAAAGFQCAGPMNALAQASLETAMEADAYLRTECLPGSVLADSWTDRLWNAVEDGEITEEQCFSMLHDYVDPALDTTISAICSMVWLLGRNPDEWTTLRQDRSLIANAINEVVRLESPVRAFSRWVTRDADFDEGVLHEGDRVIVLYSSANRDERKWPDPDRFSVQRSVGEHVGFGYGRHACAGMHLARLEMRAILTALLDHVTHIEVGTHTRPLNNTLRTYSSMEVDFS